MKRILLTAALLASFPLMAAEKVADKAGIYTKEEDKAAYSIGYFTGKANVQHLETLNVDAYVTGFRDAYAKNQPQLTEDEMKATLEAFKQKLMAEAAAKEQKQAADNKVKSAAFLAENAKKPGVTTTSSGLQYEVLTQGKGAKPKATDTVTVQYEGKFIDGTVFDSSIKRGEPATFELDKVIPGWTEAVQLMQVGSKYRLTLPPELGYGENNAGPIPGNSVLIFEVELISIVKPEAAPSHTGKSKKK
jgi:FKBP-type peptidyl-prolyl cis-trans isomerase